MIKQAHSSAHSWRGVHLALVTGMLATAVLATVGCSAAPQSTTPAAEAPVQETTAAAPATEAPAAVTTLEITDTKVGKGAKVKSGDKVKVYYTGYLLDGTKFDSNVGGKTLEFVVGTGYVIPGWDQGLVGMQAGGKRVLIIPSDLAYGANGSSDGTIPPNAPLKFEVELVKIDK